MGCIVECYGSKSGEFVLNKALLSVSKSMLVTFVAVYSALFLVTGCVSSKYPIDYSLLFLYMEASTEEAGKIIFRGLTQPGVATFIRSVDVKKLEDRYGRAAYILRCYQNHEVGTRVDVDMKQWGGVRIALPVDEAIPETATFWYADRNGLHPVPDGTRDSWASLISDVQGRLDNMGYKGLYKPENMSDL